MAKIELSIHQNYVSDWGAWEGIREVMQNALDEHDRGHPMSVKHEGEVLTIGNDGSELKVEHLLLGFTDKAEDKRARGEKGEGLDLGLLALVRGGFEVEVRTPTETWIPVIEPSEIYGQNVLFLRTRKVQKRRLGTIITIKGTAKSLWDDMKIRFLDLQEINDSSKISIAYHGDLLLSPAHRSKIYVKGIYVQDDPELKFGYNFHNVSLDRDRRMVSSFDLQYTTGHILSRATKMRPDLLLERVFGMLNNDGKDTHGFGKYIDGDVKKMIAARFRTEHGNDTIPVGSMGESEEMEAFGARGVVTPLRLRDVIAADIETPQEIKAKAANAVKKTYSWDSLKDEEKAVLRNVSGQIQAALDAFRGNHSLCNALEVHSLYGSSDDRVFDFVNIVDFRKDATLGTCSLREGGINIARKCLSNYFLALRVMVHEVGHKLSASGDTTVMAQMTTEEVWTAITYIGKPSDDE